MFSDDEWKKRKGIVNLGVFVLPMAVFLLRSSWSSLVSAVMYFVVALVIATMSGINIKYILGVVVLTISIGLYSVFSVDYRTYRVLAFLNPAKDAGGAGYMNIQLRKLLASAGLFGNGFDTNTNLILTLPEMHTNLIFSYIVYTLGWMVGAILISLIIIFFIRLIKTFKSIKNSYGRLIVGSFASIFIVSFHTIYL
ncbi:FtsW/RodA/SpoVE family cell cycle protein [Sporanaerobacter sp.]|jgi:rod shape determining protein RodA|uniref:FtsW/RodA/SpoVE family cell cycle protein n=1 Tax=Sporanaerobacter sp. TaxID=2010183 RepID=UPI003A0FF5E8